MSGQLGASRKTWCHSNHGKSITGPSSVFGTEPVEVQLAAFCSRSVVSWDSRHLKRIFTLSRPMSLGPLSFLHRQVLRQTQKEIWPPRAHTGDYFCWLDHSYLFESFREHRCLILCMLPPLRRSNNAYHHFHSWHVSNIPTENGRIYVTSFLTGAANSGGISCLSHFQIAAFSPVNSLFGYRRFV